MSQAEAEPTGQQGLLRQTHMQLPRPALPACPAPHLPGDEQGGGQQGQALQLVLQGHNGGQVQQQRLCRQRMARGKRREEFTPWVNRRQHKTHAGAQTAIRAGHWLRGLCTSSTPTSPR